MRVQIKAIISINESNAVKKTSTEKSKVQKVTFIGYKNDLKNR
jgi:hypothetical protein